MTDHTLEEELAELEGDAVPCLSCPHTYPQHPGGGHCTGVIGGWSSRARGIPCPCPGMRWVPADVEEPPTYG